MSEIKVNSIKNTNSNDGGVAIDSSGHVQVDGLQMPTAGALFARNRIINGSMEVAQRRTSSTGNGYVSLDRWYVNQSGGSTTFSQETFAAGSEIGSLKNYAKLDVTTSSDFTHIRQLIEDVRTVPAGTVTVSFYAKGTSPTGGLAVSMVQNFGTSGSSDVDIAPQTVTLTSSWQRFDLQFTVPSISGKTINANSFFQVAIGQGSNTGTTAFELNITGVQLEVGEKATPFEYRSYGDELARCQRYYVTLADGNNKQFAVGTYYTNSQFAATVHFPVSMRAVPTLDYETGTSYYRIWSNGTFDDLDVLSTVRANINSAGIETGTGTSGTQGHGGVITTVNNSSYIAFAAEL